MFIREKGTTPNGTHIQIEDWNESYPGTFKKNATIAIYPMAIHDIYDEENPHFPAYPKRGETFRSEFDFSTEEEAKEAFKALQSGKKSFMDFLANYSSHVISKDNFINAITA